MIRSFRFQLAARFSAAMTLGLIAISTITFLSIRESVDRELNASLLNVASIQAAAVTDAPLGQMSFHEWELTPEEAASVRELNRWAQVWSADGESLLRTRYLTRNLPLDTGALRLAATGRLVLENQRFEARPIRSLFYPLERLGPLHAHHVLQIAAPLDARNRLLARLVLFLGALTVLVSAATFAGGWWLAARAVRPVNEIIDQAEAIGGGTLQRRIQAAADSQEYHRLVGVLNTMLDRLQSAFDTQKRFTADASHELRSPLTALRGELEIARRRDRSPDEYRRVIDSALEETERLSRVTDDLLTLARSDAGELRPRLEAGDLCDVALHTAERLQARAGVAGVRLTVHSTEPVGASFDRDLIGRLLWNLVENAVKFTPPDGHVDITVARANGRPVLRVADTGPGIPSDQLERVFERFFRADESRTPAPIGGTGLGLAIARSIALAHGATIRVRNRPAGGAEFEVTL